MILSRKKKFVFLAFNKTGSSSIENILRPYQSRPSRLRLRIKYKLTNKTPNVVFKHMSALQAKHLVGDRTWEKFTTCVFVRNPWDRIVSLYEYHHQLIPHKYPLAQKSFEDWIRAGGTGTSRKLMSEFVTDEQGNVIVDFVGRFENLENDYRSMLSNIGIPYRELGHSKETKHKDYKDYYTDETRDIVTNWVRKDAEMFGYTF